ncbi:MAG: RidA family protein [Phycisphaeraceae bacterium]
MSNREVKHPEKTVDTGAYSVGVVRDGWLFISGQGPLDLTTGAVVGETIEQQTQRTLEHIEKILRAAGASRADVVRCTCYLSTMDDFAAFNRTYQAFFDVPVRPARTTVAAGLAAGLKVEIDAVAKLPADQP